VWDPQVSAVVNQCITRVADVTAVERAKLAKVYVANLTYLGPAHGGAVLDMSTIMSSLITSDPENSCGIILLPNTGVMSAGHGPVAVRGAQRGVEARLSDEGFHLEVREFNVTFSEDSMYSQSRALSHPGLLVFSDETFEVLQAKHFRCKFAKSALGVQRIVKEVAVVQRSHFVNPVSQIGRNSLGPDAKQSQPAEYKQHVTGASLYMKAFRLF
jgi:hypothetical protein